MLFANSAVNTVEHEIIHRFTATEVTCGWSLDFIDHSSTTITRSKKGQQRIILLRLHFETKLLLIFSKISDLLDKVQMCTILVNASNYI